MFVKSLIINTFICGVADGCQEAAIDKDYKNESVDCKRDWNAVTFWIKRRFLDIFLIWNLFILIQTTYQNVNHICLGKYEPYYENDLLTGSRRAQSIDTAERVINDVVDILVRTNIFFQKFINIIIKIFIDTYHWRLRRNDIIWHYHRNLLRFYLN